MTLCTALRKMSLVFSSRKLRQPMIWLCHAIRFLSLVVSCACSVSLRFSSDRCLASSCISSRLWSFCMVWILSYNRSMVSSCVEISQHLADLFVPVTVVLVADGAAVIIHPVVNDVTMWMVTVSMPGDDELRVRNSHQLHIVVGNL